MPFAPPALAFDAADARAAHTAWGCNCGPAALAAACGLPLEAARALLPDFATRRVTTETMLARALAQCGRRARQAPRSDGPHGLPRFGLARIQWDGPWLDTGSRPHDPLVLPYRDDPFAPLRQSHWVASVLIDDSPDDAIHAGGHAVPAEGRLRLFDWNALAVGGWISLTEWREELVPWLLAAAVPGATGRWWVCDSFEIDPVRIASPGLRDPDREAP